jgi:hypothetical protein
MPTAPIRSKLRRSPTVRSPSANHNGGIARKWLPRDQRLQASASTTIASTNSPTKRSMMLPTRCGERRKGIGSVLSGRMVFIKRWGPANLAARDAPALGRGPDTAGSKRFQCHETCDETAAPPRKGRRRPSGSGRTRKSAVAKAFGGAFPLRHVIGDHPRGFHRGLAELGIAGDFALYALAFGMQQVAQALEFRNQVLDLRQ